MKVTIIVRDDGSNAEIYRSEHRTAVEPQVGDRLIHVVIDGYLPPVVEQRDIGTDAVTVRCRATRRSDGVES